MKASLPEFKYNRQKQWNEKRKEATCRAKGEQRKITTELTCRDGFTPI